MKRTIRDANCVNKTVLVRVDFNVPLDPITGEIADDTRIFASLPTIRYLQQNNCKIILCSHFDRPNGKIVKDMRMFPVAKRLNALLGQDIIYLRETVGDMVREAANEMESKDVMLLENVRFHDAEETNEIGFCRALASLADIYVNDAFSTSHRDHASISGIADFLPSYAGFQMEKELRMLSAALDDPARPMAAIMGGAKIVDKINLLRNMFEKLDLLVVGGGMAMIFFAALGYKIGESTFDEDSVNVAKSILELAKENNTEVILPTDLIVADSFSVYSKYKTVQLIDLEDKGYVMDIGPKTLNLFISKLNNCKTIVWNGPMGVFEFEQFSNGTKGLAEAIASIKNVTSIVGGGSTAEAINKLGLVNAVTHISTGGGASLEFLEGKDLVGVSKLPDKDTENL
jgi:3-phosphoglycerate kinase